MYLLLVRDKSGTLSHAHRPPGKTSLRPECVTETPVPEGFPPPDKSRLANARQLDNLGEVTFPYRTQ